MKYTHTDIVKIINEVNLVLEEQKKPYKLVADFRYESISISSIEKKRNKEEITELMEYSTRDETYRWLEGFITSAINY